MEKWKNELWLTLAYFARQAEKYANTEYEFYYSWQVKRHCNWIIEYDA